MGCSMLDTEILRFFNRAVGISPDIDFFLQFVATRYFLKGGVILALLWWSWVDQGGKLFANMYRSVIGIAGAIIVGRALQVMLPFRLRPIHDPDSGVILAQHLSQSTLQTWSSLPSDHAVMFFAIATAIWLRDRRVGLVAYGWALLVGCLPRVALGLHYPSDIATGAIVGIAVMALSYSLPLPGAIDRGFLFVRTRYPAPLLGALFLLSFCAATMFEDVRQILRGLYKLAKLAF